MLIPEMGSIHLFKVQSVDGVPCIPGTVDHSFEGHEALFVYDPKHQTATASYPVSKRFALYAVAKDAVIIDYKNSTTNGIELLAYQVIDVQPDVAMVALTGVAHISNNIVKGDIHNGKSD